MILPLHIRIHGPNLQGRTQRALLLATSALIAALPLDPAMAQVIIGGDQEPPAVEVFPTIAQPQPGQWPYTVKKPRRGATLETADPESLPSRQVDSRIMEAARLQQSGLTPIQVREAMTQPAPLMAAPELAGPKPEQARDNSSTLPAVATGALMASMQADLPQTQAQAEAPTNSPAVAPAATDTLGPEPIVRPAARDTLTPLMGAAPEVTPEATAATGAAPRPLFGGRTQVAQVASNAEPQPASAEMPAPDAAPAMPVLAAPTEPVALPESAQRADNQATSQAAAVAPLTSQSSAPRLLARMGDRSRGVVERPDAPAAPVPVATPEPTADVPAQPPQETPQDLPQDAPKPQPAAVLPGKSDETATPTVVTVPDPEPVPNPASEPAPAAVTAAPAPAPAKPAEKRSFWDRLFGRDPEPTPKAAVVSAPVIAAPVVEAPPAELPPPAAAPATPVAEAQLEPPAAPLPDLASPDITAPAVIAAAPIAAPVPLPPELQHVELPAQVPLPEPAPQPEPQPVPAPVAAMPAAQPEFVVAGEYVQPLPGVTAPAAPTVLTPPLQQPTPQPLSQSLPEATIAAPVIMAPPIIPAAPVAMPEAAPAMAPVMAPVVPTFRVEAPAVAGATGLVTPRLVEVTPQASAAVPMQQAAAPAMPSVSVPSGAPLAQVNFLPASQSVDSVGAAQLQAIAEAMQMAPQSRLLLNAYAKASSTPAESRRISLNRALVVRSKLAELGIQPARIDVQALGEDAPDSIEGNDDRVDAILR